MSLYCPECNGVVYNRRNKLCGFCGSELPAEFLFTEAELAALAREEAEAEEQRRRKKAKEQAEEEDRRRRDASSLDSGSLG